jgi:hypothetical protein
LHRRLLRIEQRAKQQGSKQLAEYTTCKSHDFTSRLISILIDHSWRNR